METGDDGQWHLATLAPGRWSVEIRAAGFRSSRGWIDVSTGGPLRKLAVAMRPLNEVTPIFGTNPQSISNWIEMGNDLLEQGHPERARIEYLKALDQLPTESQPEVLRAVARTQYLQGELQAAQRTLEKALGIAPGDVLSRQLLRSVSDRAGTSRETELFLARLDRGEEPGASPPGVPEVEDPLSEDPRLERLPLEASLPGRTGYQRVRFPEKSPFAAHSAVLERLGIDDDYVEQHDPSAGLYDLAGESFHLYVPPMDPPNAGYGLIVWISPLPFGGLWREELQAVLDDHRLIWIGADHSGNRRLMWYRIRLALDAAHNAAQLYAIDHDRIYAAGYSGGGRIASALAQLFPEVFRGGFSFFGCDYWSAVAMPHMPGAHWPAAYRRPPPKVQREVRDRSRFVLLTGELDFNRSQTWAIYRQMIEDGFEKVELLVIPGASHYHPVENTWFAKGIEFLDQEVAQ